MKPRRSLPKADWDGPFYVAGGIFTDMTFTRADSREEGVPSSFEFYGPFDTYEHAVNVWRGKSGYHVDNCFHRLFVVGGRPKYEDEA